ncbi:ATP-binding cassette domain-containing protein, partial [bacterium]|nr:ATP-binding cassette domain-containing protein [bacterium]
MPINFHDVSFIYNRKSPLEYEALKDVSLDIENGSFVALVGRTGCGKSTLIQHINALLNPTSGEVKVDDFCNSSDKKKRTKKTKELRRHVGLV